MKRIIIILGTILMLSSCITQQKCNQLFPPQVKDSTIVQVDTVWRDSIVTIPSDSVVLIDSIPCPDYEKEINGLRSKIKVLIKKGKLTATCTCDSIEMKLRLATIKEKVSRFRTETRFSETKSKDSWWNTTVKVGGYIFISLLLLALIYGIYRLLKFLKIIK